MPTNKRLPIIHELKTVNPYFDQVSDYVKRFELRFDDRDFMVGDTLILKQYAYNKPTGTLIERKITYILRSFKGLQKGYVILGME